MPVLILMRGVPGSGKSSLAKKLSDGKIPIHSTDNYFMKDGVYQFNAKAIGYYHKLNLEAASKAMRAGLDVIVDNTNTTFAEMKPYILVALETGHEIVFQEPTTSWKNDLEECTAKNTHNVPKEAVERMLKRMQPTEDCIQKVKELREAHENYR